jgi:hypothetical protein
MIAIYCTLDLESFKKVDFTLEEQHNEATSLAQKVSYTIFRKMINELGQEHALDRLRAGL